MSVSMDKCTSLISNATLRNWNRLSSSGEKHLDSRANKKCSDKKIFPAEYLTNSENLPIIDKIIETIRSYDFPVDETIYSLGINLLLKSNLFYKPHVQQVLKEYTYKLHQSLLELNLPENEIDILGLIYQCLLNEGDKNIAGAYYTPHKIATEMTFELDFSKGQTFFDPCCGSGSFILSLKNAVPEQIFAVDINPIAVLIAKFNMILKFAKHEFIPNIKCCDYLDDSLFAIDNEYLKAKYDYIVTNPPWGAVNTQYSYTNVIKSKETFSLFYVKAYSQLKNNGTIRFLFPESILNVKVHKDIREFILNNGSIRKISFYSDSFTGVTTKFVDILCTKNQQHNLMISIQKNNEFSFVDKKRFLLTENKVFNIITNRDNNIIKCVREIGQHTLDDSMWALGIVTGDNKSKLKKQKTDGYEDIYTGKEIVPYRLKPAQNFILYDRNSLQQVAKDEFYRAKEKLVYKFVSNKPIFAYDNTGALVLNSANILIPKIPNMSIKTTMAFLNSQLYQYLYITLFSEIKILKGNLCELPFPKITSAQNKLLESYSDFVINGDDSFISIINDEIFNIFGINITEQQYIKEKVNGTFNN